MEPAATATVPSILDDLPLDTRIYHPKRFSNAAGCSSEVWQAKGAIIAHPYAPLGGSYDDAVVCILTHAFLKLGFVVGTFNFRGAVGSKGRTSWTSKPESKDYMSFAGFFVHYLNNLRPLVYHPRASIQDNSLSPIRSSQPLSSLELDHSSANFDGISLVVGGYSYGSLIVSHLPTTDLILKRFENPKIGSAESEICLRAASIAMEHNHEFELCHRSRSLGKPDDMHPVKIGGDESEAGSRRRSKDSRRSIDRLKRSFDISRSISGQSKDDPSDSKEATVTVHPVMNLRTYYLLVSPLLPPIATLAVFFSAADDQAKAQSQVGEVDKLCACPTLAIFGSKDMFTSVRKLRKWSQSLASDPGSRFEHREIEHAGHFWMEASADRELSSCVHEWLHSFRS